VLAAEAAPPRTAARRVADLWVQVGAEALPRAALAAEDPVVQEPEAPEPEVAGMEVPERAARAPVELERAAPEPVASERAVPEPVVLPQPVRSGCRDLR
jgi:hypothetical protein